MCSNACKTGQLCPCFSLSFLSETIFAQTPLSLILCLLTLKKGKATTNISPVSKKEHILPRPLFQESGHSDQNKTPRRLVSGTLNRAAGGGGRSHSYPSTSSIQISLLDRQGNVCVKQNWEVSSGKFWLKAPVRLDRTQARLCFVFQVAQNQPNLNIP